MVRNITEAPCYGDFIITIRCPVLGTTNKVWSSVDDTVASVKEFMGEQMELFSDEMTVIVGQSHPYPLSDTMPLSRLIVEHRHLTLLIHEGKDICYGASQDSHDSHDSQEEEESSCAWWGQPVPDRYIGQVNSGVVFDFRYLSNNCVPRIRSWMYRERNISEIWLLGTHPRLMEILYAIAEDVLCLNGLQSIVIQNPACSSYSIPYKSLARHTSNNTANMLQRSGLVYLYQHLLLDQYRPSAETVEIWVDGGLLFGQEERTRFYHNTT